MSEEHGTTKWYDEHDRIVIDAKSWAELMSRLARLEAKVEQLESGTAETQTRWANRALRIQRPFPFFHSHSFKLTPKQTTEIVRAAENSSNK